MVACVRGGRGKTVYRQTPEQFAEYVPQLVEAGAGFISGCCGTAPEFIGAIRKKLQS
jgi:5-methyltetrahydrofolate--homocysteine methyltransferase